MNWDEYQLMWDIEEAWYNELYLDGGFSKLPKCALIQMMASGCIRHVMNREQTPSPLQPLPSNAIC
jgi:hypothetical protein